MTKIPYVNNIKWTPRTRELVDQITNIVEDYQGQGYQMTLRQLYYQLVSRSILPNETNQYAKLGKILTQARLNGIVDWDFIVDNVREPKFVNEFDNIQHAMDTIIAVYRRRRWENQNNYVEVIIEKDALANVLNPVTQEFHVRLLVNRGYGSTTAMHDLALRMKEQEENGKDCYILYFGDFDPSGEDMVRDIKTRLETFGSYPEMTKVALTTQQIRKYNPPPNPAKSTDPRYKTFGANHGHESWELDALPPNVLVSLVRTELNNLVDMVKYEGLKKLEEIEKKKMRLFGKRNSEN